MLTALLSLLALPALAAAQQSICYDYRGRAYYCNRGLSNGARIGVGIGVAVGVLLLFLLCGMWRRKQLRAQWAKHRPPVLPVQGQGQGQNGEYNPYANNPPPPSNTQAYGNSSWNNTNVAAPPATYQPSMAGQYTGNTNANNNEHEHGYEWEQAREAERLEREAAAGGAGAGAGTGPGVPPPGYNTTVDPTNGYAPPSGAPPTKSHT